jgi:hypothetical protein
MRQQLRQDIDLRTFDIGQITYHAIQLKVHPNYWATTSGHVISTVHNQPKVLADRNNRDKYLRVNLNKEGKKKTYFVHRLIAGAFLEAPGNDRDGADRNQVNHINGLKADNKIANLEFASPKENADHYWQVLKNLEAERQEPVHVS